MFNKSKGGITNMEKRGRKAGFKHSEETKKKMSESHKKKIEEILKEEEK